MISAQFRIQLPEHLWVSELFRQFTRSEFNLLSGFELDGRALELGEVVTEHPGDVVEAMRTHEAITSFELLESEPGRVLTKYETPQTALYGFAESSSLTIEFPVEVRRGWYRFDLTGTREDLEKSRAALEESPRPYELESLVTRTDTDSLLTNRQRRCFYRGSGRVRLVTAVIRPVPDRGSFGTPPSRNFVSRRVCESYHNHDQLSFSLDSDLHPVDW